MKGEPSLNSQVKIEVRAEPDKLSLRYFKMATVQKINHLEIS